MDIKEAADRVKDEMRLLFHQRNQWAEEVALRKTALEYAEGQLRYLEEQDIPNLLFAAGVPVMEIDGHYISSKDDLKISILAPMKEEALDWMEKQGYGALIKHNLTVDVGRKPLELVERLKTVMQQMGYMANDTRKVEPQTLKKFGGEALENGVSIPDNMFSVYQYKKTVVKEKP